MNISNLSTLSPTQLIALSKAVDKELAQTARDQVQPGQHIIPTFQVEVSGNLKVSEDEQYTPTTSISLIGATALALRRMGIQRGPFLAALKEVCQDALSRDEQTRSALMAEANVREFQQAFKEEFTSQLPELSRKGKTRATLLVTAL